MDQRLLNLIRDEVRQLSAYHVPPSDGMVKLDAMENPYRLPDDLLEQLKQSIASIDINRYPDPAAKELTDRLSDAMDVPEGMATLLGNGSDEIIQILAMALAKPGATILSFEPGFVMYRMIALFTGMTYEGVPLTPTFEIDLDATLDAIEKLQPAIIFIAYPNNPTGNLFSDDVIGQILEKAPGFVVIDEAYQPFAISSYMPGLKEHDNLLVMRTVSKMGLAGLRLGLLAGKPEYIEQFNKVRLPYNINVFTQTVAELVLENQNVLQEQATMIRNERERMFFELSNIPDVQAYPSQANFILFRVLNSVAADVHARLIEQSILIKNMNASDGLLANCLRVTVGTPEENSVFLDALTAALK